MYCCICVLILLYMCPHTAAQTSRSWLPQHLPHIYSSMRTQVMHLIELSQKKTKKNSFTRPCNSLRRAASARATATDVLFLLFVFHFSSARATAAAQALSHNKKTKACANKAWQTTSTNHRTRAYVPQSATTRRICSAAGREPDPG